MSSSTETASPSVFAGEVRSATGVVLQKCYQCGKCSAGCPMGTEMDLPPSLVMRKLQTGEQDHTDSVLRSMSIWLCVSCEMCVTRCPMEIDIPRLMDFLRQRSMQEGKANSGAKKIISFHRSFLDSINYTGRLYEVGLIADYKLRTGTLSQDVAVAPKMFVKGKLNPVPEVIRGRKKVSSIFGKTIKKQEGSK